VEQLLGILAALTIGIVLGSVSAWLILRGQLATIEARVKSESQVDMARLNERLTGSQEAVTRAEARHAAFESLTNTLRSQLNETSSECGRT